MHFCVKPPGREYTQSSPPAAQDPAGTYTIKISLWESKLFVRRGVTEAEGRAQRGLRFDDLAPPNRLIALKLPAAVECPSFVPRQSMTLGHCTFPAAPWKLLLVLGIAAFLSACTGGAGDTQTSTAAPAFTSAP